MLRTSEIIVFKLNGAKATPMAMVVEKVVDVRCGKAGSARALVRFEPQVHQNCIG